MQLQRATDFFLERSRVLRFGITHIIYFLILECTIFTCYYEWGTLEIWLAEKEDEEKMPTSWGLLHGSMAGYKRAETA